MFFPTSMIAMMVPFLTFSFLIINYCCLYPFVVVHAFCTLLRRGMHYNKRI
jgi:hypothetical protein